MSEGARGAPKSFEDSRRNVAQASFRHLPVFAGRTTLAPQRTVELRFGPRKWAPLGNEHAVNPLTRGWVMSLRFRYFLLRRAKACQALDH